MRASRDLRSGVSLIELLVVIGIMGLMMSLLLPALNSAREAANETVCKNNLHQLSAAMADTPISHYMLVIDAPFERRTGKIRWEITDRQADLPSRKLPPWYVGPEMHPAEFRRLNAADEGPHRGGVFFP